jgi:tetratricopeptide (TPR) repeat protein
MKRTSSLLAIVATAILQCASARAQESVWQSSYQFESAGKYNEAIFALESVPVNGPDAELKLLRRGWLFYQAGKFDESIREYRLAIERNGRSIDARLGLLLPMLASKRWREAEQTGRAALDLAPHHYTASVRLAIAQEGMQDWPALTRTAATLVADYPSDATAYTYLARANAWQGKRAEATVAYSAVLARYPTHQEAKAYIDKK